MVNLNSTAESARPTVSFYLNDGASGGPGTIVGSFTFNAISIAALTVSSFNGPTLTPAQAAATGSADCAEAANAFLEKRDPVFQGR